MIPFARTVRIANPGLELQQSDESVEGRRARETSLRRVGIGPLNFSVAFDGSLGNERSTKNLEKIVTLSLIEVWAATRNRHLYFQTFSPNELDVP